MTDRTANYVRDFEVGAIRCPHCGEGWVPSDQVFSEMVSELERGDHRFDSAKARLGHLLEVLVDNPSGLFPVVDDTDALRGGGS